MKTLFPVSLLLLAAFVMVVSDSPVQAQGSSDVFTQVAFWEVPRETWTNFEDHFDKYQLPVLEKMLADGVIVEFGFDAEGLHQLDGYTHSIWFSAHSLGDLEKVLDAQDQSLGPNAAKVEAELAGMISKHEDLITQSSFYDSKPAKLTAGHAVGNGVRVKRNRMDEFKQSWESWAKPVYDRLLAEGTIVAYVLDSPYFHTSEASLGSTWTWYVLRDLSDEHKVEEAFSAARGKLSQAERDSRRVHYLEMIEEGSHRDAMTRLIHFQSNNR